MFDTDNQESSIKSQTFITQYMAIRIAMFTNTITDKLRKKCVETDMHLAQLVNDHTS